MSLVRPADPLRLPASLEGQLVALRRRLWTVKSIEAAGAALVGVGARTWLCLRWTASSTRPSGHGWQSSYRPLPPAGWCRSAFTAGSGVTGVWIKSRGSSAVAMPAWAIKCWGSLSWYGANSNRTAHGLSALQPSSRWPKWPATAIWARPCHVRGTGIGVPPPLLCCRSW